MSEDVKPSAQVVPDGTPAEPRDPDELSDADLAQVSGGRQSSDFISKTKSADKNAEMVRTLL